MKIKILLMIGLVAQFVCANEINVYLSQNKTSYIDLNLTTQQYTQKSTSVAWPFSIRSVSLSNNKGIYGQVKNDIYHINSDTGAINKFASLSGLNTFEVGKDCIYGITDSALYKINYGTTNQLCSLAGYADIAVSPEGRIVGFKAPYSGGGGTPPNRWNDGGIGDYTGYQTNPNYGLFEIDPLTGSETRLSSFIDCSESIYDSETVTLYAGHSDNNIDAILTDLAGANLEICFSNDGLLWLNDYGGKIHSLDLDNLQTVTGWEYLDDFGAPPGMGINILSTFDYYTATSYDLPSGLSGYPFDVYVTPEPTSLLLLSLGGLFLKRRK